MKKRFIDVLHCSRKFGLRFTKQKLKYSCSKRLGKRFIDISSEKTMNFYYITRFDLLTFP